MEKKRVRMERFAIEYKGTVGKRDEYRIMFDSNDWEGVSIYLASEGVEGEYEVPTNVVKTWLSTLGTEDMAPPIGDEIQSLMTAISRIQWTTILAYARACRFLCKNWRAGDAIIDLPMMLVGGVCVEMYDECIHVTALAVPRDDDEVSEEDYNKAVEEYIERDDFDAMAEEPGL